MSRAERFRVPLNSKCSRKCDAPARSGRSSREPMATQIPMVTERTPGMCSVTIRRPDSYSLRSITGPARASGGKSPAPGSRLARCVPARPGAARTAIAAVPSVPAVTAIPAIPALTAALCCRLGLSLQLLRRGGRLPFPDGTEPHPELEARLDLHHDHVELVAHLHDVLDRLDPLTASPELGDVDETVDPRKDAHEGAELGGLHHLAVEDLAHLGDPGVEDLVDHLLSLLGSLATLGPDEDGAVVLDVDVGARGGDDLVDPLPLGPDDLPDLVHGDLDGHHPRGLERQRLTR